MSSATWLRELGAVRPMAPSGHDVLVLGEWSDGYFPIEWSLRNGNFEPFETWRVFGLKTAEPLTREDCVRILERCK